MGRVHFETAFSIASNETGIIRSGLGVKASAIHIYKQYEIEINVI